MPLEQAFSLTPRDSYMRSSATGDYANVTTHGSTQYARRNSGLRQSFDHQHQSDELWFHAWSAGEATTDYNDWRNRWWTPHVQLAYDLSSFGPNKEVALTFRFDAQTESRVLVYTHNEVVSEEILHSDDNQFLIHVETTERLSLQFLHVNNDGRRYGGNWYFQGIDGYIA